MAATRSAAAGAGSGDALASSDSKPALMRMATRTYRELIWSLAFGLVTVATAPLMVVAMLALGAFKTASDYWRTCFAKRAIGS